VSIADPVEEFLTAPIDHVTGLPWPFQRGADSYRYSVNVEPARTVHETAAGAWGRVVVDLGGADYVTMMTERRAVLDGDPGRTRILPGMELACWDLLLYYLREMALTYPRVMSLQESVGGDPMRFHWRNLLLDTDQAFAVGDESSIPHGPLGFLGREAPDDLILMRERDGGMHFDAGCVAFAAQWSAPFSVGMTVREIHAVVPRLNAEGISDRAEEFMLRLPPHQAFRRINWNFSSSLSRTYDVSLEKIDEWGPEIPAAIQTGDDLADYQFRIEIEHFFRLPMSGAVTFNIRSYMASLAELRTVPEWALQLATIVEELPDDMAEYKDIHDKRHLIAAYLRGDTG
jgi:hypothetical protein